MKSMLLKASSGKHYVRHNFALLVRLGDTCFPHCVSCHVPNEIDYGKINVETNPGTAVSTRTTKMPWRN